MVLHLGLWSLLTKLFLSCELVHALKLIFFGGGGGGHVDIQFFPGVGCQDCSSSILLALHLGKDRLPFFCVGLFLASPPCSRDRCGRPFPRAALSQRLSLYRKSGNQRVIYPPHSTDEEADHDRAQTASAVFRCPMLRVWPLGSGVDWTLTYAFVSCVARGK